jgi:hypothetical protein
MKPKSFYNNPFTALSAIFAEPEEGENFLKDIKESKYEKVDVKDVISKQSHLTVYSKYSRNKLTFFRKTFLF